MGDLDRSKYVR